MRYRVLGRTGIEVSIVSFGAGPVSGLMTGTDADLQTATVAAALAAGINWFDTAAGYGRGASETNLGRALRELRAANTVHIATKVRIPTDADEPIGDAVQRSVEGSLQRLGLPRVALLQLHNGLTGHRGDEAASVTPADVLGPGGVLDAFRRLRDEGLVRHLGLTGTGQPAALREVIRSGWFDAMQVPYNLLNPSAGQAVPVDGETDYGNVMADCAAERMGVFAIRIFAGGALLGQPPGAHTQTTPFFPLALYERDLERARRIQKGVGKQAMSELAVRFALAHPAVTSAIIGFGSPRQVADVVQTRFDEPLPQGWDLPTSVPGGPANRGGVS
jgi:aryl-alcohol dehydrogenase-like predicted oxidoreductase